MNRKKKKKLKEKRRRMKAIVSEQHKYDSLINAQIKYLADAHGKDVKTIDTPELREDLKKYWEEFYQNVAESFKDMKDSIILGKGPYAHDIWASPKEPFSKIPFALAEFERVR